MSQFGIPSLAVLLVALLVMSAAAQTGDARRGEYLFQAGGCGGCHTDVKNNGKPLAGGRALPTPFGTFYGPNITPDPTHGIGKWTEADFIRALRKGVRPDGSHYFAVFPYPSFTGISDSDLKDMFAYLRTVPTAATPNRPHDVPFPFNLRFAQTFWKMLFFAEGPFRTDAGRPSDWNRGAYLVNALGHCGECHTPRNFLGGSRRDMAFAGTSDGPEGERVPNITTDKETGIGNWSAGDLADLLKMGMTPEGDFVGGSMGEVVKEGTSKLSDDDVKAIIAYLKSLSPIKNKPQKTQRSPTKADSALPTGSRS
jgi:mono/diheme cytochrome c family protein